MFNMQQAKIESNNGVLPLKHKQNFFSRIASLPLAGVAAAMVTIFIISCFLSEYFFTIYNMTIIARTLAFVGLITIGQSMLMLLGELDLSLGAIAGFCGVIGGILMVKVGLNPWVALCLCLLLGLICGLVNGLLVTTINLHSLVLTVGTSSIYGGVNLVATKGVAITGIPNEISFLGKGAPLGLPVPFIIMLFVLIIVAFIAVKTTFGRYIYSIGNNFQASKMLGIRVNLVRVCVFGLAGFLAALAGMLMVARLGTAQPSIGATWVMSPIAAAVIGGVATTGGVGSPIGAIFGCDYYMRYRKYYSTIWGITILAISC